MTGWRVDLLLLVTNAVYGTAYVTQREALTAVPPALLAFARLVTEHLSGARDHARLLWSLVVFEQWRAHYLGDGPLM